MEKRNGLTAPPNISADNIVKVYDGLTYSM
jgi:hypothetical protein